MIEFGKYSDGTPWKYKTFNEELSSVQLDLDQSKKALADTKKLTRDHLISLVIPVLLLSGTVALAFIFYRERMFFYIFSFMGLIAVVIGAVKLVKDFKNQKIINISLDLSTRYLWSLHTLKPKELERIKKCREVLKRYSAVVENTKFGTTTEELEDMVLSGQTPEDFETQIKSLINSANKKEAEKLTSEYEQVRNKALADFEAKQKQRDQILSALKKRIKEIEQRVKSGDLEEGEGELLKSSAKRDIEVNLQALDQA